MKIKNLTMLTIIFTLIFLLVLIFLISTQVPATIPVQDNNIRDISTTVHEYNETASSTRNRQHIYTNKKYGFRFAYPEKWRVGNNDLEYGTLQLFNYLESQGSERGGSPTIGSKNKIEAAIIDRVSYGISGEYPEKNRTTKQVIVAEQTAIREEIELIGGEKILFYSISLPSVPSQYLGISIYGDPSNFYVLDEIVKSIKWMQ